MEVDDREYCRLMLELTSTDGWKVLISEYERDWAAINSVVSTIDNDDLHYRKGQLERIASVLNHRDRCIEMSERLESDI
tara:strand:+ start:230 stop:466 length:237 start_codon:yes stop_codon:yes gene_type:complete